MHLKFPISNCSARFISEGLRAPAGGSLPFLVMFSIWATTPAMAIIPWFAQDVGGDLRNHPEMAQLVGDSAAIFLENTASYLGTGDTYEYQDPATDPKIGLYTNLTNIWYAGQWWYAGGMIRDEGAFYHSADPSLLQGWRESPTSAFLRWDGDNRFVPVSQLGIAPSGVTYRVLRREQLATNWQEIAQGVSGTSYTDTGLDSSKGYEYKITSTHLGQDYEFTLDANAVSVDLAVSTVPRFYQERQRFQEYVYHHWWDGSAGDPVEDPIVWPVRIRHEGSIGAPENVTLEVWTRYRSPHVNDLYYTVSHSNYDAATGTLTFSIQMNKADFKREGGFGYRVVYNGPGGSVVYPAATSSGQLRFIRPSVNNRVFTRIWTSYAMNVDSQAWRDYYTSMVQALDSGVTFGGRGQNVNFDTVFCDVVQPELGETYNQLEPIEYAGGAAYSDDVVSILNYVDASISTDLKLYLNCRDLNLMDRLSANTQIGGIFKENWTRDAHWFDNPFWAARFTHASGRPDWRLCLVEHEYEFHQYPENRLQALVAYMVVNNSEAPPTRETLLGYGDWTGVADSVVPADLKSGTKLLPEQLIPLGAPHSQPFAGITTWPSTAELQSWDTNTQIAQLRSMAPALFIDSNQRFMGRRYRYLDGVNYNCSVWGMIDTGSTGPGSASMAEIVPAELIKEYYYELDLSAPDPIANMLVEEGAGFRSIKRSSTEQWPTFNGDARVFFEQPVESPTIGTDFFHPHDALAEYDLQTTDLSPVLAVRVSQWTGQRMREVRIAVNRAKLGTALYGGFTSAGWPNDVILTDDGTNGDALADDGIYSARPGPIPAVTAGAYEFPIIVTGTDGLMRFGTVTAQVAPPSNVRFVDGSGDTGGLQSLTGQPYSAIYIRTAATQPDEKLLLVSKDGNDAPSAPQIFREGPTQNGSPFMQNVTLGYFAFDSQPEPGGRGVSHADYDNDGDEDLFLCNVGQAKLYQNQSGTFVNVTEAVFSAQDLNYLNHALVSAWGDYNRDGWVDLYVSAMNYTGTVGEFMLDMESKMSTPWSYGHALFRNGFGKMARTVSVIGSAPGPAWCASFGDVDADSLPDLVVGTIWNGATVTYRNQGFSAVTGDHQMLGAWSSAPGLVGANSLTWLDYDHNPYPDLVLTETNSGRACILSNSGSGFLLAEWLGSGSKWTGASVADFDQDGYQDVLLMPSQGQPELHVVTSGGIRNLGPVASATAGSASGSVVTDFNDDGDLDLYLGRPGGGEFLYKNVRPASDNPDAPVLAVQNYLQVVLETLGSSNRSLIGTRVHVSKSNPPPGQPQSYYQTVDGGSGRGGQGDARLHFGLGAYTGTVNVTVHWPSGGSKTVTGLNPATNHRVTIVEDGVPQIVSGPYFGTEPYPGGADWNFSWITDHKGDIRLDSVEFQNVNGYGVRNECYAGPTQTLTWQSPNVRVRIDPHPQGWLHVLTWTGRPCVTGCGYQFTATSGVTGFSTTSAATPCSGCVVTIPYIPHEQ